MAANPPLRLFDTSSDGSINSLMQDLTNSSTLQNVATGSQPQHCGRSLSQLRMQAQGALLNLFPHNIRYKELVQEGIDPTTLKNLYDGIGIKGVAGESVDKEPIDASRATEAQHIVDSGESSKTPSDRNNCPFPSTIHASTRQYGSAAGNVSPEQTPTTGGSSATPTVSKPLERKDLIARMLAAKAGKSTVPPPQENQTPSIPKETLSSLETTHLPEASIPSQLGPAAEETRNKEKSKAQTELARQRMEQLRKMGISNSQSQSTSDSVSGSSSTRPSASVNLTPQATTPRDVRTIPLTQMKHPLPERPPDPAALPPMRIPGLFMTEAEDGPEASLPPNDNQSLTVESSLPLRIPRKRPRAADFNDDTPEEPPRKQLERNGSSNHRVVIDISDDDSMYDADMSGNLDSTANLPTNPSLPRQSSIRDAPPLASVPSARSGQPYRSVSSGSLPQPSKDEEDMRSQILMMHQKIAEMERRRDAKLAAKAQAIVSLDYSGQSPPGVAPKSPPLPRGTSDSEQKSTPITPAIINSPMLHSPLAETAITRAGSSSQPVNAEELRRKLLRKKEIESGLPTLEAELLKAEAKLAQSREEQDRLLAEIAKGQEGKRRLIEELEELGIETEGLTFDELQSTKNQLEAAAATKEQTPVSTGANSDAMEIDAPPSSGPALVTPSPPKEPTTFTVQPVEPPTDPSNSDVARPPEVIDDTLQGPELEPEVPVQNGRGTPSSRSSSAMDESMGSSVEEPDMLSEGENPPSPSLSGGTQSFVSVREATTISNLDSDIGNAPCSRKQSATSDAYEPPETIETVQTDSPITRSSTQAPESTHDDLETRTQEADNLALSNASGSENAPILEEVEKDDDLFTPYLSPLRLFKAYRYHPNFLSDIGGGFRSLTFSHNIDPNKPLCDFEAAGGICNDKSCHNQHFRDMILSDDKILVEMGSLREGKTPSEREDYVSGLKQIINDMRRDKVKDFTTVATEIASYRRRFLQDSTRVLAL